MAANASAVWRVRPSGNNNNGGGFDCAISSAATGTHGSFSGTTFTDATAAAFTAGMVGSAINITGIGQYKITARIDASNVTLGSGNPALTFAGPLSWTVGAGQDYSQQNGAQVTQSGGTISTSTVTLTDTGASFTAALIGNAIRVAGTGITTTYTFITAVPSGTTLTLQTSPGTTGTSVTYNIGGGWADFWTNTTSTAPTIVAGNTVYILGSGTPNPASYTYDYDATASFTTAGSGVAIIGYANDPATPGYKVAPDTTGGMPVIKFHVAGSIIGTASSVIVIQGLWFVGTTTAASKYVIATSNFYVGVIGCVLDQFGFDCGLSTLSNGTVNIVGSEAFSSVAAAAGTTSVSLVTGGFMMVVNGCNFHDCIGLGVNSTLNGQVGVVVLNSIIAKCGSDGVKTISYGGNMVQNCTIDANLGYGINIATAQRVPETSIFNNIISNHTQVGKGGIQGTTASGDAFIDYNVFYNNTTDYLNVYPGPHDTHGGSNPYVGQTTENFTLL